jgi:hypothetical protein
MSVEVIYFCDMCKKRVADTYGPILVEIRAPTFTNILEKGELCSHNCTIKWTSETLEKLGR